MSSTLPVFTGTQILEAVRDGTLLADFREEIHSLEPLAKACPEDMPRGEFDLMLDEDRTLCVITCAYNVQLAAPVEKFEDADFEVQAFPGFPRGCEISIEQGPGGQPQLSFAVPSFLSQPAAIPLDGLNDEEAQEVLAAVSEAVGDSYESWEPELPGEEEVHAALVKLESTATFSMQIHDNEVGIELRAGTHLGLTAIAVEHDYEPTVHTTVPAAAKAARDALEEDLRLAADGASELGLSDLEQELLGSPELADAVVLTASRRR